MDKELRSLQLKTKANDVDEQKGIVTIAVNGIGIKDTQGDICLLYTSDAADEQ